MLAWRSFHKLIFNPTKHSPLATEGNHFDGLIESDPTEITVFVVQKHLRGAIDETNKHRGHCNTISICFVELFAYVSRIQSERLQTGLFVKFAQSSLPGRLTFLDTTRHLTPLAS